MKAIKILGCSAMLLSVCYTVGCTRGPSDVWEDTKTSGRYVGRGVSALGGKHGDSRQIQDRADFCVVDEPLEQQNQFQYPTTAQAVPQVQENEFVPLQDENGRDVVAMGDMVPQPRETPGEAGSSIPNIDAFRDPMTIPQLAKVFQNIRFEYNSNLIKGQENLAIIKAIADYMRQHGDIYIFAEGHADERGPDAYNLALGARRSNTVRNLLIQEGVSPDNVFTISYGKERPLVFGHDEESWGVNRRVEFKVYQR